MNIKVTLLLIFGVLIVSAGSIIGYKYFSENYIAKKQVLGEKEVLTSPNPTISPTPTNTPTLKQVTPKPTTSIPVSTNTPISPTETIVVYQQPTSVPQQGPTACQQQISELMGKIYGDYLRIRDLGQYFGPYEEQMRQGWLQDIYNTRQEVYNRMTSCPGSQEYYDAFLKKFQEEGIPFP